MIKENTPKYKIKTLDGYKDFDGMKKIPFQKLYYVSLENGGVIKCTKDHNLFYDVYNKKPLYQLSIGDKLETTDGKKSITSIIEGGYCDVYDVLNVEDGNKFLYNDVLVSNCEFIGKSNALIDTMIMRQLMLESKDYTHLFLVDNDIKFFDNLNPFRKYLVALDTGMGVTGDYSAIQVFEFPGFKQIGEWKSDRLNQNDQVEKMKNLTDWMYISLKNKGNKHPEIYWSVENNSSGEGFICALREKSKEVNDDSINATGYIKRAKHIAQVGNKRIGFTTTHSLKMAACSQLKILIESNRMKILSKDYITQLGGFTGTFGSSFSSKNGNNDDLITASLTIIYMYLQCRESLDLDMEIMPTTISKETNYSTDEFPFLFDC